MVDKSSRSVLGDEWFQTFLQFRASPESFLDKRKLTRDAFCLDVLKDLYRDHADSQFKIHLLLLLQEHSSQLITDINLLEQIIGSLINLYKILGRKPDKRLLKSQILVTVTTSLLTSDLDYIGSNLLSTFNHILLDVIYSDKEDTVIVSTACKCLEEIEIFYPNILEDEIKNILSVCESHLSPAFQSYVTLLSLCIKNRVNKCPKKDVQASILSSTESREKEIQVLPIVSYFLEVLPLMTHIAAYRVLKDLIFIARHTSELVPGTFKLFLPSLIMSSELIFSHLAFDLLEEFGSELYSTPDEKFFLRQLISLSVHPCLTASHRLLYLDWLKICLAKKDVFSQHRALLPGPFDGPVTQEKKSCVLSFSMLNSHGSLGVEFLNESVSGLKKCALLPKGTKFAASFFRTLFVYFANHKNEAMCNSVYKLLLSIIKTAPHLSPYALSFLQYAKVECNERNFSRMSLNHLVDYILSIPMKQFASNLEYYLAILKSAAEESGSVCKPRSLLRLLQKLLTETDCYKNNIWFSGNDILSVCRSLLKYHDVHTFYYDLAEVLCLIMQNFNDVDIKDRAKVYYSMLVSLSKSKIQSIFVMQTSESDAKNALTSFVPGANSNLQFAFSVQKLPKPVLEFVRVSKKIKWEVNEVSNTVTSESDFDISKTYFEQLSNVQSVVTVPFLLRHVKNSDKAFSSLYGIVVATESSPSCIKIKGIEIPVLKQETSDLVVHLELIPAEPYPLTLYFKAEFTCANGYSYGCHMESIVLNFEDLFLPLPLSQVPQPHDILWKQHLFESLWNTLEQQVSSGVIESKCCQSSYCLKITKEELELLVQDRWGPFILARFQNSVYFVAIHLPPKYHLLMKTDIVNEKPFLNIFVDNSYILPWLNLYFQEIGNT